MSDRSTTTEDPPLPEPRLPEDARRAYGPGPARFEGSQPVGIILDADEIEEARARTEQMRERLFRDHGA